MLLPKKNNSYFDLNRYLLQVIFFVITCLIIISSQALDRFEVSHAQTTVRDGQYFLSADIAYSLHAEAKEVLDSGLPIRIELQVELFRVRRYWRNKIILNTQKIYLLKRNAVTERFVLTNVQLDTQVTFETADEAIRSMRFLEDVSLVDEAAIVDPLKIQARARLVVDVRHFPAPLQYLAKYWDDWRLVSQWYEWPLKL